MKLVIQRVQHASVTIDQKVVGRIGSGYLVLVGVAQEDTQAVADKMIDKMLKLRIFADEQGKTNLSLKDVGGEILLVSQFTLYADCRKGNRPSFIRAGKPDHAQALYDYMVQVVKQQVEVVQTGEFGADMQVELLNDGPFTIILDSEEII